MKPNMLVEESQTESAIHVLQMSETTTRREQHKMWSGQHICSLQGACHNHVQMSSDQRNV